MVANLLGAEVLVLLTDQPGMLDADPAQRPDARRIPVADPSDSSLDALAGGGGLLGRGGMITKLRAARLAASAGAHTVIADGGSPDVLDRVAAGEDVGTLFIASDEPLVARKRWLAGQPPEPGARPAHEALELADFEPLFQSLGIRHGIVPD